MTTSTNSAQTVCVLTDSVKFFDYMVAGCSKFKNVILKMVVPTCPDSCKALCEADVVVGKPADLDRHFQSMPRVKWMHSTWAGVELLVKHPPPTFVVTRTGGIYGQMMAEFVIAQIINRERHLFGMYEYQKKIIWSSSVYQKKEYRPLSRISIGILGIGDIGQRIAEVCSAFGMTVWGVSRTSVPEESRVPYIHQYRLTGDLAEVLENVDYICSVLPNTPSTRGLLDGDILEKCAKKKAVLINVGRGSLLCEQTIIGAIRKGWISGAILDVFEVEPLPPDSELWKMPEVIITPHCSALAYTTEVTIPFLTNLELFLTGKPLNYIVNWSRGY